MPTKKKKVKAKLSNKKFKTAVKSAPDIKHNNQKNIYRNIFLALIVGAISWIVLSPSLKNSLTNWDDPVYVYESEDIKSLSNENIKHIFSSIIVYNYHPLTILSLAIDYKYAEKLQDDFFGVDPYIFHRTSLIFHVLNTMLVFLLFYFMSRKKIEVALIVALLFGIHPMHVESVSWVSERKDVLYTFFFVLGLIVWYKYNDKGSKSIGLYVVTLLFFILSLLSKPAAAAFAPVLLLFDYLQKRKFSWKLIIEKIPFFIGAFIIVYVTYLAQSKDSVGDWAAISLWERFMFASYGFMGYIIKFIAPLNLSAFYPYPTNAFPINETLHWTFYAAPFVVVAVFALLFYLHKKNWRLAVFSVLFYFFTIAMVLQFVSVGKALMAERYSYVPYLGLSFLFAEGFSFLWKSDKKNISFIKYIVAFIIIVFLCLLSYSTYNRTKVWKNNYTLWTDVINKYPRKVEVAYKNRGNYFARETEEFDKALNDYKTFLELNPNDPSVYSNRGNLYGLQEKFQLAIADYTKAISLDSNYVDAHVNRAITYMKINKADSALYDFNYAVKLTPGNIKNIRNRAYCYVQLNKSDSAISEYSYVISKDSSNPYDYFYRGIAYFQIKDYQNAIIDNTKAIEMQPDMGSAYLNRAISYKNIGEHKKSYDDAVKAKDLKQNISDKFIEELKMLIAK